MKTKLFNPFIYIAGAKALLLGFAAMAATAILCYVGKIHLDGIIDVHLSGNITYPSVILEPIIDWLSLIIPLFFFGKYVSESSIRFIDIAGTAALARYPLFFVVLITMFFPDILRDPKLLMNTLQTNPLLLVRVVLLGLAVLPFIVWTVALMYNAYSVSANVKGSKATWTFIASIVIAEIVSKVIVNLVL